MKRIYLLLLIATALSSCSNDSGTAVPQTIAPNKITFDLQSQEKLSNVTLLIEDSNGNILKTQEYVQVDKISYEITTGSRLVIKVQDEDYFQYVWKFFDKSGNNIYEQVVSANMTFDVTKNYSL